VRIGVVSDTHDNLDNVERIVELFNGAGVERVVHTGDITQAKTLRVLAGLRIPLVGVYGNNDQERESLEAAVRAHGFHFVDPPLGIEWAGRRIVVVHDPTDHGADELYAGHVLLHGHDHILRVETREQTLVFNPGECAGHIRGHNAIGVLDLVSLETEILRF
jgi:putative phosphoesterase